MEERKTGFFLYSDAIRIAKEAYADAIRDMSEEDLLDEELRDTSVNDAIQRAFMERLPS